MAEAPRAEITAAREMRDVARDIFRHALAECSIQKAFDRSVYFDRSVLRICDDLFALDKFSRLQVLSFGKAAHTMAEALSRIMGVGLSGIIAGPTEPENLLHGFRYYCGGHPTPNQDSVGAARAMLRAARTHSSQSLEIFLISGGGSSLAEAPFTDEISLPDLIATYKALVLSGAPIAEINAVRKHLSAFKGGRLAEAGAGAQQVSIMVSDVPDHALDSLASGPTMPDSSTVSDCYNIVRKYDLLDAFPKSVREMFDNKEIEETPKSTAACFVRARWCPILSSAAAQKEAAAEAARLGFVVEVDNTADDADYRHAADHLLERLRRLRQGAARCCLIMGGEVTVKVKDGGTGGRNQQFALYCAQKIAGENIAVLSAGTDGIDGNSPAAGAVVDGTTLERAHSLGLDPAVALARFDAYPLFDRLADAIMTGPTGNNVRDLRILLAW